jgi:hypothetical protein
MLFSRTSFVGIDPTAGQRPFTYAALDQDLRLIALAQGSLDEVTAFAGGQRVAIVAVNAPRQPNQGLLKDEGFRATLNPSPAPGRWQGYRLAEYQLYQHNIHTPRTPAKIEDSPRWMQMGFQVYKRLRYFGYELYPAEGADCQLLETYPHGAFCALLGTTPFPKRSLEGRLQRQLILHEIKVNIPNPMRLFEEITRHRLLNGILNLDGLLTSEELDALVGAYTAWYAANQADRLTVLGDRDEGQVFLPAPSLAENYPPAASY